MKHSRRPFPVLSVCQCFIVSVSRPGCAKRGGGGGSAGEDLAERDDGVGSREPASSGDGKSKSGMQTPGSIAAANLPCDDRPSDAAFGHVVFGGNATMLRPLKDPPGMPTEDVLTLLESRILGLSVDRLTTAASDSTIRKSSDALLLRCSDAEVGQDRASGVD